MLTLTTWRMCKFLARIVAKRPCLRRPYQTIPGRSNRENTWSSYRIRFGQVPQGDKLGLSHARAGTHYRDISPVQRIFLSLPGYLYRKWTVGDADVLQTFGLIGLPICPVVAPNTWSGYDPVHHPYRRYLGRMCPRGCELVDHYTSNRLARP